MKRLSKEEQAFLDRGYLAVRITIECDADSPRRSVLQPIHGDILLTRPREDSLDQDECKVGECHAYRQITMHPEEAMLFADAAIDQDIYEAFSWLHQMEDELSYAWQFPVLLDKVVIYEKWRNKGLTLPAVATFLDQIATQVVFLMPFPMEGKTRKERESRKTTMKRYWEKLGFNRYDQDANILFVEEWRCPDWLKADALERNNGKTR